MKPAAKRVAVVGAGPSGLATVKALLEEGHEPTCFERAAGLGGVFRFDERDGVVWESCRLTSSGLLTAFSDFPVAAERAEHMTVGEYVDYLRAYVDAFGLDRHIQLDTTVESVARDAGGAWVVRTVDAHGHSREERYDAVAVCSGLHQYPHRPHFPGQEAFTGQILHGAEYRRPAQVSGKRVLIVGAGESGADIVAEVAGHAVQTVLSLRRGVAVLPRKLHGRPNDYVTTRISSSPAHWIFQTRSPDDDWKRRRYAAAFLPVVVLDKCVQLSAKLIGGLGSLLSPLARRGTARSEARIVRKTRRLTRELLRESGGTLKEQFGTKTDDFVRAIAAGRCRRVGPIRCFEGGRVVFEDGSDFEPELVILCTGFEAHAPFLDEQTVRAPRYLHTFVPSLGPSLGLIGFVRPSFGAIPPLAELQARWFALLLSGASQLPPEGEMQASIERHRDIRRRQFRAVRGRLDYLVDFASICDELAAVIGCKPTRAALRRESAGFRLRFFCSPFVAAQYRLVGPHAEPSLARQVIEGLPVAHPFHALATLYVRWTLSRILHRALGPQFAPKLVLD